MTVHTKLQFCNDHDQDRIICVYKTKTFTGATNRKIIEDYILKKYKNARPPFDIRILDQQDALITLDQDYVEEYDPFSGKNLNVTTAEPINFSETTVTLRIFLPNHILGSIIDQRHLMLLEGELETITKQTEQTQRIDDVETILEPPKDSITLYRDPKMGFADGHNVNYEQRDQYICDQVNVATGKTTGKLTMLQGEKNSTNKYKSILPRFKIWDDDIKNGVNHVWTLLVYIVWDVRLSGKRSLVYHPQKTFVKNGDVIEDSNPYEFPVTTDDWMTNMGVELNLTIVTIEGAKKHPNAPLKLICEWQNIDQSGSSDYCKSRLALFLRKDTIIQWDTLVLSNEMMFIKKTPKKSISNILDVPVNASSTSGKRKRSKQNQTTSKRRSKSQRTNGDSSIHSNQNLPINHNDNQSEAITSQTMLDIPIDGSQLIPDLTEIESSCKDPNDIMNTDIFNFDFLDNTNTNSNLLGTGDLSFNLSLSSHTPSSDS